MISQSIVRALAEIKARRVALFTPYTERSNESISAFLKDYGFDVTVSIGLGLNVSPDRFALVSDLSQAYLLNEITAMDASDADCIMISCTDLHTADLLAEVARRKALPTITSNQAFFNDIARAAGCTGAE